MDEKSYKMYEMKRLERRRCGGDKDAIVIFGLCVTLMSESVSQNKFLTFALLLLVSVCKENPWVRAGMGN